MTAPTARSLLSRLDGLQSELVELAFVLERRGRLDAADVALAISSRVAELGTEHAREAAEHPQRQ